MGILHFRSRRATPTQTQTLPLRPSQPSAHGRHESRTSRLPHNQRLFRERDIRYRETNYESSSESSGDESCCDVESKQWIDSTSLSHPGIQLARQNLLPVAHVQLESFFSEATYTEPPRVQQECGNGSIWPLSRDSMTEGNNQYCTSDYSFVIIPTFGRYFHYRCPFYALDPRRYQSCMIQHELHSIESVIKHVKRHHARPPYCPRCSKTFETVSKCDRHILEKRCRTKSLKIPDGVNFYQRSRLSQKDNPQLSNRRRWERMYNVIFPEAESCPSPYLDSGVGLAVSMARDFWRGQGRDVVSEFLAGQNWLSFGLGDDAHAVLYELVLFDLIRQLVEEG
ncbi:hypothetical protein DER44DRAFT_787211 [Fusarium oxysporum]|nr:hypothetical protein DER44DRAFT_787211 [Fusarium oxysporum]